MEAISIELLAVFVCTTGMLLVILFFVWVRSLLRKKRDEQDMEFFIDTFVDAEDERAESIKAQLKASRDLTPAELQEATDKIIDLEKQVCNQWMDLYVERELGVASDITDLFTQCLQVAGKVKVKTITKTVNNGEDNSELLQEKDNEITTLQYQRDELQKELDELKQVLNQLYQEYRDIVSIDDSKRTEFSVAEIKSVLAQSEELTEKAEPELEPEPAEESEAEPELDLAAVDEQMAMLSDIAAEMDVDPDLLAGDADSMAAGAEVPEEESVDPDLLAGDADSMAAGAEVPEEESVDPDLLAGDAHSMAAGAATPEEESVDPDLLAGDADGMAAGAAVPEEESVDPDLLAGDADSMAAGAATPEQEAVDASLLADAGEGMGASASDDIEVESIDASLLASGSEGMGAVADEYEEEEDEIDTTVLMPDVDGMRAMRGSAAPVYVDDEDDDADVDIALLADEAEDMAAHAATIVVKDEEDPPVDPALLASEEEAMGAMMSVKPKSSTPEQEEEDFLNELAPEERAKLEAELGGNMFAAPAKRRRVRKPKPAEQA